MPPETRLFLLITPPQKPFGSIEASCTVVGKTHGMFGIGVEISSAKELEMRLATAGLPESEIDRALLRLEVNHPTFSEISHAAAESLRLIERFAHVSNCVKPEVFDLLPSSSGLSAAPATLPV